MEKYTEQELKEKYYYYTKDLTNLEIERVNIIFTKDEYSREKLVENLTDSHNVLDNLTKYISNFMENNKPLTEQLNIETLLMQIYSKMNILQQEINNYKITIKQ